MRPIPILIGAIVLLIVSLAAIVFVMQPKKPAGSIQMTGGASIDSGARIEIEMLRQQIEHLNNRIAFFETEQLARLEGELNALRSQIGQAQSVAPTNELERVGPNTIIDAYAQVVLIANRRKVNKGIQVASPSFLEGFLGRPRVALSDDCQPMTNPKLSKLLVTEGVGPIRVTMLRPAVESLKRVFANVKEADSDLYDRIASSGSLCVRQIRGTRGRLSTHAFGLAVDLNIDGVLDRFTDGKTQLGLTIMADFMNAEGWVWGAGFSREDSMHFEVSRQQLEKWRAAGKI